MHAWVGAWMDCWMYTCMDRQWVNSQVGTLEGERDLAPTSVENRIWEAGGRSVMQQLRSCSL